MAIFIKSMKTIIAIFASLVAYTSAFHCGPTFVNKRVGTQVYIGKDPNVVLGGNDWKPDSGGMRVSFSFKNKINSFSGFLCQYSSPQPWLFFCCCFILFSELVVI